ncbi:MAG: recombination protein NinG [Syntrophales bacterium]
MSSMFWKDRKQPKTSRKRLIDSLDRIFSQKVRDRDKACRRCGNTKTYTHHIFSRKYMGTRWDMENGISLCLRHHRMAHGDAQEFLAWVISWMGQRKYDLLQYRALRVTKYSDFDLEQMKQEMRAA